jgi:hypothetical protein
VVTREGWSFLWRTGISACGGSNDEWWSFHHDERGTANYGVDGRPPGAPENVTAARNPNGSVTVSWKQPGDDWLCGAPARYRVVVANGPIPHPSDGQAIADVAATGGAGQLVSRTFTAATIGGADSVAVLYRDEAGNWGLLHSDRIQ